MKIFLFHQIVSVHAELFILFVKMHMLKTMTKLSTNSSLIILLQKNQQGSLRKNLNVLGKIQKSTKLLSF